MAENWPYDNEQDVEDTIILDEPETEPAADNSLDDLWTQATTPPRPVQIWSPVANVGLVHEQICTTCLSQHAWFSGWFTEQRHATDPHARRLVAGKHPGLVEKVERHAQPAVSACSACVESQVAITNLVGALECPG